MISFSSKEVNFLEDHEECRIATSHNNIPHVKPVSYIFYNNEIIIATDYNTLTFRNLKKNPRIALTIDVYQSNNHKAVLIQGLAKIIESGIEFKQIYKKFHEKFDWVKRDPWNEKEAPFIKIIPKTKTSWGIN